MSLHTVARPLILLGTLILSTLSVPALATTAGSAAPVRIGYLADLQTSVVETRLVGQIIHQQFHVPVRYVALSPDAMWRDLANDRIDISVSAWLQTIDSPEYQRWWTKVTNLGTNVQHTRVGLVVPDSADTHSIRDLKDQASLYKHQILVVHNGTDAATAAQQAIKKYGLDDFGTVAITADQLRRRLAEAKRQHLHVVAAVWGPSRIESTKGLRWLSDSADVFEANGDITTIVSNGLLQRHPDVYHFLHRYYLGRKSLSAMMHAIDRGEKPAAAAAAWRNKHPNIVAGWLQP